jgi:hypothetical protein
MFYGTYFGVTLIGISRSEGELMLPYLNWTFMMFTRLIRPKIPQTSAVKRFFGHIHSFETILRANTPGMGWTGGDGVMYTEYTGRSTILRTGVLMQEEAGRAAQITLLGVSEEFTNQINKFGAIFSHETIGRLCKTLDRRLPNRVENHTPTNRAMGIKLVLDLFWVLGHPTSNTTAQQDQQLKTGGKEIIQALRVSHDLKLTLAGIDRWVSTLAAERHLSPEFVAKQLRTDGIV